MARFPIWWDGLLQPLHPCGSATLAANKAVADKVATRSFDEGETTYVVEATFSSWMNLTCWLRHGTW